MEREEKEAYKYLSDLMEVKKTTEREFFNLKKQELTAMLNALELCQDMERTIKDTTSAQDLINIFDYYKNMLRLQRKILDATEEKLKALINIEIFKASIKAGVSNEI